MPLQFHKGIDYAVVMLPHQTTDSALARLYGRDKEVTKFGNLFAASEEMVALLQELIDIEGPQPGNSEWAVKVRAAIAKATGAA